MQNIIEENSRRKSSFKDPYNPLTGSFCCGDRVTVKTPVADYPQAMVPKSMVSDPDYDLCRDSLSWQRLRCVHDFEFWAIRCAKIYDKTTRAIVPFRLNRAQRRVLSILEAQRLASKPLRLIVLKARQWGCSTLMQMYMAWIQLCHRRNWNSLICAHVRDSSANIRGMYKLLLENYPKELLPDLPDGSEAPAPKLLPFENSQNIREIAGRGCRVTIASAESQDSMRGADIAMAHLSEVAFWPSTVRHSPEAAVQAIAGSVSMAPCSFLVMESTANGIGNFFHSEWLRCSEGRGDKTPVFVPWYEIEIYRMPVDDPEALWNSLDDYERNLWDLGLSLEQIAWYHNKRLAYSSRAQMQAEFPTSADEAFANSGNNVFASDDVARLRRGCRRPAFRGTVTDSLSAVPGPESSPYCEWEAPAYGQRYIVTVDIGGRSPASDFSVIAVLTADPRPEVVAQWRGHIDHDLLASTAAAIAGRYNHALLVVESNTLETEAYDATDPSEFILNRLTQIYDNVYWRETDSGYRVGFHMNRTTKSTVVAELIAAVRDSSYIERDSLACDELAVFRLEPGGSYSAPPGAHDDILITRAIALHVIPEQFPELFPAAVPSSRAPAHALSPDPVHALSPDLGYTRP